MILITGDKGFIGGNLAKSYKPEEIITISNYTDNLNNIPWHIITKVYHMGAISSTTETDIDLLYRANVKFTIDLFDICAKKQIPITYASSASVYGNSYVYAIQPLNYYAMTKAIIDYKAQEYISNGVKIVGLRFYNVYGHGEDHKGNQASPIHQFTTQALKYKTIKVFEGSENFIRDFVFVGDVVCCIKENKVAGIYDVGTSNPISFLQIAKIVSRKYNAPIETIPFPKHLNGKYQIYTCSRKHFNRDFISVQDFLESSLQILSE